MSLLLHAATETANADPNLTWLYILIPGLFGGYGISSMIGHFTKRATDASTSKLEGTRLGQDIMERAMIRLDKEVADLRQRDIIREEEFRDHKKKLSQTINMNNALIRYLTKLINYIKSTGGTVPQVDIEDEEHLRELSVFAKLDNTE